jgi:hypothetical protein
MSAVRSNFWIAVLQTEALRLQVEDSRIVRTGYARIPPLAQKGAQNRTGSE